MPAANYTAITEGLLDGAQLVSLPLDVDVLYDIMGANDCRSEQWLSFLGNTAINIPMRLTLFYDQEAIDLAGVKEDIDKLKIYAFTPNGMTALPSTVDPDLNRVTTMITITTGVSNTITGDGIFAIGWKP